MEESNPPVHYRGIPDLVQIRVNLMNSAITGQNQLKFCQQTLLEDMQLIIEKIWSSRTVSTPDASLGFYDKGSGKDNVNLTINFFRVSCTQIALPIVSFDSDK